MKILFVSSSSGSRGGGELYLLYLASALKTRGHTVGLWMSADPQMDELAEKFAPIGEVLRSPYRNTYLHRMRSLATTWNFRESSRIAREWKAWKPDIIHLNKQNLEDGLDLLRACQAGKIPSCCTIHLTQSATYLKAHTAWLRDVVAVHALSKYQGVFITVQEGRAADLRNFLGPRLQAEVVAVPNGVPLLDLYQLAAERLHKRFQLGLTETDFLVLGVGRMMPQKRPFLFLDYAEKLLAECPAARVIWIGSGWLDDEWDAEVLKRGLQDRLQRVGWQQDIPSWLAAGDVFLHTAEYEGMPLALFEAMSARLPCVITANLLKDMPFLDTASVAVAEEIGSWREWFGLTAQREAVAAAGRHLIETRFSHDRMASEVETIYTALLNGAAS